MSIKTFCDGCGQEITKENEATSREKSGRLAGQVEGSTKNMIGFEVIHRVNGSCNAGHVCKYCLIDAINTLDDRTKGLA